MSSQEMSELKIAAWLLPEKYKLTDYYRSLPEGLIEKQKALAVRWMLEGKYEYLQVKFKMPLVNGKSEFYYTDDLALVWTIKRYYKKIRKKEWQCLLIILHCIYDMQEAQYSDVLCRLCKEYKKYFPNRRKAEEIINILIDKGIVKYKIRFKQSGKGKLLKPHKTLVISWNLELKVMNIFKKRDDSITISEHGKTDDLESFY